MGKRRMKKYTSQTAKYHPLMPSGDIQMQKQYTEEP
jgi:hypothetical protein